MESAAVLSVAAGIAAAALQLGWAVASVYPLAAAGLAALPIVLGAAVVLLPAAWAALGLTRQLGGLVAGVFIVIGAAGEASLAVGWYESLPKAMLPVILMPLGALLGTVAVVWQGVTVQQAAILLDMRCRLGERFSTAAELAGLADGDKVFAEAVAAQALAAADTHQLLKLSLWHRSRATTGAVALAVLLNATLAFLPTFRPAEPDSTVRQIALSAENMTPAERQKLAQDLRRIAKQAPDVPAIVEPLSAAATAMEEKDDKLLAESLARLDEALKAAGEETYITIAEQLQAAAEGIEPTQRSGTAGGSHPPGGPNGRDADNGDGLQYVRVWEPGSASSTAGVSAPAATRATFVSYNQAWQAARRSASEALSKGQIPPEYRRLVRDFFSEP